MRPAREDEIFFHYPIPRNLHGRVKELSTVTKITVKDIMINALTMYVNEMNKVLEIEQSSKEEPQQCPIDDYFDDEEL